MGMESIDHVVVEKIEKILNQEEDFKVPVEQSTSEKVDDSTPTTSNIPTRLMKNHNLDDIIGDINDGVITRSQVQNLCAHYSLFFFFILSQRVFLKLKKRLNRSLQCKKN